MNTQAGSVNVTRRVGSRQTNEPLRLQGGWLTVGRFLFAALFLLCVVLFATSLWRIFVQGVAACDSIYAANWVECPAFREAQAQLGLTPVLYEAYFFILRVKHLCGNEQAFCLLEIRTLKRDLGKADKRGNVPGILV